MSKLFDHIDKINERIKKEDFFEYITTDLTFAEHLAILKLLDLPYPYGVQSSSYSSDNNGKGRSCIKIKKYSPKGIIYKSHFRIRYHNKNIEKALKELND